MISDVLDEYIWDIRDLDNITITDVKNLRSVSGDARRRMERGISSKESAAFFRSKNEEAEERDKVGGGPDDYDLTPSKEWRAGVELDRLCREPDSLEEQFKVITKTGLVVKTRKSYNELKKIGKVSYANSMFNGKYTVEIGMENPIITEGSRRTAGYIIGIVDEDESGDVYRTPCPIHPIEM